IFPSNCCRENLKLHYKKKYDVRLNFKFLRNCLTAIYRYLKYSFLFSFFFINIDNCFLAESKYLKTEYKVLRKHNFLLLAFDVQILIKIRQYHEYFEIISITSRNNTSISNFGGGFRWKRVKVNNFQQFRKIEKNKKKSDGKREFLRKTSFRPNRFFYMVVAQILITTTEIFDFYANFFLKCRSNFYEICRKRENVQMRLNFKFLRNIGTITIYPQTILNICYNSKNI
ncbi:hypothetical protein AGLY_006292, partial [Aphis glycines]